jgi:hypothetical protein
MAGFDMVVDRRGCVDRGWSWCGTNESKAINELIHILYMSRQSSVAVVERWSVGYKAALCETGEPTETFSDRRTPAGTTIRDDQASRVSVARYHY